MKTKPSTQSQLTAERLRQVLAYDPATGEFTWRVSGRGRFKRVGAKAGCVDHHGYVVIMIDGLSYQAHRLAWLHVHGEWPAHEIDHKFGVKTDNRISELRDATRTMNQENLRAARSDNSTGLLGVSPVPSGKFMATVQSAGKQHYLGIFQDASAASEAYLKAKRELHAGCTL